MRFEEQVFYAHPVLRPDGQDYADGEFQVTVDVEADATKKNIEIKAEYDLTVPALNDLISNKKASVGLYITCRETFYSIIKDFPVGKNEMMIPISGSLLHGRVTIVPVIYASESITGYQSEDFCVEIYKENFDFKKGDLLAHDEEKRVYLNRENKAPLSSIIDIVEVDDKQGFEWNVDFEDNYIKILVSKELNQKLGNIDNTKEGVALLFNSIYFSVLQTAVEYLRSLSDEQSEQDKIWANVIKQRYRAAGYGDVKDAEPNEVVQRLLDFPIKNLSDAL